MSDQQQQHHEGIIGALSDFGRSMVSSLPPAFFLLLVLNIVFLALILWFLNSQMSQRTSLVEKLVDKCMDIALKAPPH